VTLIQIILSGSRLSRSYSTVRLAFSGLVSDLHRASGNVCEDETGPTDWVLTPVFAATESAAQRANDVRHGGTQTAKIVPTRGRMRRVQVDLEPHRQRRVPRRGFGEPSMETSPKEFVRRADRGLV
jgi:hypothetical protein